MKRIEPLKGITDIIPNSTGPSVIRKINEIIEAVNGSDPRVLVCKHCGSEEWEDGCRSTLMRGPRNFYTYACKKCGKTTKVLRVRRTDPLVYLGPEDEVQ